MDASTEKETAAMPEREHTCCFTGYREYKLPWGSDENDPRCRKLQQQIFDAVDAVYADGIRHFICGMANGCDLYFFDAARYLRAMITTCASAIIRRSCRRRTHRTA